MKTLKVLITLGAILSISTVFAQTQTIVEPKGIYAEIDIKDQNRMIELLINPESRIAAIDTVFNNINKYNPPVLYTFALALFANGEFQNAVDWYLFAQLNTLYDIKRCTDISVNDAFVILEKRTRPVLEKYIKKNKKEFQAGMERSIDLFNKIQQNYDYRWINLHGMDCMITSLDTASKTVEKTPELTKPKDLWPTLKQEAINDFMAYNKK